ncbi:MAG: hypothetical protein J6R20_04290 [Clostridia bacterium]|nr:hypothetical protein [Clostridia bacterium]
MRYIKKANLPQNPVSMVAISNSAGESIKKLNSNGIKTFIIPDNPLLPYPVRSHADLQILHMGNNDIFCQNEHLCIGETVSEFNMHLIREAAGNKYPDDVRLNCTIIGNKIICNEKTISRDILEFAYINDYIIINVNQGYSRCSICVIDENTIITDDKSIFAAAGNFLNDAELISKGSIVLNGYNYGFIGGCSGKLSKNEIGFNGMIETHKDYKKIIDILNRNKIICTELCSAPLTDIGGIIPLTEY